MNEFAAIGVPFKVISKLPLPQPAKAGLCVVVATALGAVAINKFMDNAETREALREVEDTCEELKDVATELGDINKELSEALIREKVKNEVLQDILAQQMSRSECGVCD